jgi:hypothetical protein
MEILVETEYFAGCQNHVELEGVDSLDQIKSWYVKWGCFFYTVDGENWNEVNMMEEVGNNVDAKQPISVRLRDPDTHEILEEDDD